MLRINKIVTMVLILGLSLCFGLLFAKASLADQTESVSRDYDNRHGVEHRVIYHPYLDIKVWVNKGEGAVYHPGEEIKVYFRASHDCYVVIYDIDTRGYVHLLYPTDRDDDPYVEGGRVYRIPDRFDDYDLTVDGPEGVEYVHAVASLDPIDYPNFPGAYSDDEEIYAYKLDGEDPFEFMADINREITSYDYASDVCIFRVEYPHPKWYYWPQVTYVGRPVDVLWGGVYFGYPWGVEVWIDGVFYGITPITIPAIVVGRHYYSFWFRGCWIWRDWIYVRHHHTIRVWPDCWDRYRWVEERIVEKSYRAEKAKRRRGAEGTGGLVKPVQYRDRGKMARLEASRIEGRKELKKELPTKQRGTEKRPSASRFSDDPKPNRRIDKEHEAREIKKSSPRQRNTFLPERRIIRKENRPGERTHQKIERSINRERIRKTYTPRPEMKTDRIRSRDRERRVAEPATVRKSPEKIERPAIKPTPSRFEPQGRSSSGERSQTTRGGETRGGKSQGRRR